MSLNWKNTDEHPQLATGEIHVWRMPLVTVDYQELMDVLSEDEIRRAERFMFERHREHYVVGRARMRQLLGRYAGCNPSSIEFQYANLGKPRFRDPDLHARFRFNFSNSNDKGLLGITELDELGVDIEKVRPMNDMAGLAQRYYAETECQKLFNLPTEHQLPAFFRCWTRKESYLKAVGKGLTFPLHKVEVTLFEEEPCRIVHIDSPDDSSAAWSILHLEPFTGYCGCLGNSPPR